MSAMITGAGRAYLNERMEEIDSYYEESSKTQFLFPTRLLVL